MNRFKGFSALFFAAMLYAINDILIRVIGTQLTTFQQLLYRSLVGVIIISIIIAFTKPRWSAKKINKVNLFFYALAFPITVVFYTLGILNGKIASVVFAFYAGSFLFSFLSEIFIFKELVTTKKLFSLCSVFLGLMFFTYPFGPNDISTGFFYGLLASAIMTFTNSMNKHIGGRINYEVLTFLQMFAGVFVGILCLFFLHQPIFPQVTLSMTEIIIASGFFLMAVVFLAAYGFKHFDLHLGTIVTSLELFFAPLFAFFMFQEKLTNYQLFGGLLLAIAIVLPNVRFTRK